MVAQKNLHQPVRGEHFSNPPVFPLDPYST